MQKVIDLTGQVFGRLTATKNFKRKSNRTYWEFICECGVVKHILTSHVKSGKTSSCGCLMRENVSKRRSLHKLSKTPEYQTWNSMVARCYIISHPNYKYYGARGITVCDRWLEPDGVGFLNFLEDMGTKPENLTLDRTNNNQSYCPENCRWATRSIQTYNKRTGSNNTSGKVGVRWDSSRNKWHAYINKDNKTITLGFYIKYDDAVTSRVAGEVKYYGVVRD